ncbi:MAG: cysteine-rich small domain-containing protein [Clostridioides sp.]|jgi:Zn-finger protein|nr:cysteine-rich small domain-containing protein [Clostridioides sp.]
MSDNFKFFCHKKCEYFPCHKFENEDEFNCLFCYCPLYALGDKCGGNPRFVAGGIKDCSNCTLPHHKKNYEYIMKKYMDIVEIVKQNCNQE